MSKQKTKMPPAAKFKPGDKVRVMQGVMDTDYPDMPLGGWAGTIAEVHDAERGRPGHGRGRSRAFRWSRWPGADMALYGVTVRAA